jgi:hypothetical protein
MVGQEVEETSSQATIVCRPHIPSKKWARKIKFRKDVVFGKTGLFTWLNNHPYYTKPAATKKASGDSLLLHGSRLWGIFIIAGDV